MNSSEDVGPPTSLSVEAKVFIPSHTNNPGAVSGESQTHLKNVPHYMKTCYPFVNNENVSSNRAAVPGSGPGRPPPGFGQGRSPGAHQPPRFFTSPSPVYSRGPSPNLPNFDAPLGMFNGGRMHMRNVNANGQFGGYQPILPNGMHLPPYPPIDNRNTFGLPCPSPTMMQPFSSVNNRPWVPSPPVHMISSPRNSFSPDPYNYSRDFNLRREQDGLGQATSIWNNGCVPDQKKGNEKKSKKKKANQNGNMVSVGTQNEVGLTAVITPKEKRKMKTHTLICMDAAIQTDFSDEIANLTLLEKPNGLYKKDKTRNWLQQYCQPDPESTTESEEIDSDSGYSSPLHRRNLASNGTQPAQGFIPPIAIPSGVSIGNGMSFIPGHHPVNPMNAFTTGGYAYDVASMPVHSSAFNSVSLPMQLPLPSCIPQVHSYAAAAAAAHFSASSAVNAAIPHNPTSMSRNTSARSPSKDSKISTKDADKDRASSATKIANADNSGKNTPAQAKKKQKKRNKPRKKASNDQDDEVLSDDAQGLYRVNSTGSLNNSAENKMLQFEDDDFPALFNAASGLNGGLTGSSSSYSEALKSPRASNTMPKSVASPTNSIRDASSNTLLNETGTVADSECSAKESKALRKRRKRLEIANRAAEEELAEISLEQQVLVELSGSKANQNARKSVTTNSSLQAESSVSSPVNQLQHNPQQQVPQASGKRSQRPISLNIADMITALEKQPEKLQPAKKTEPKLEHKKVNVAVNPLDASAPSKRGKERENPKPKKPSALKKVILKEREAKKQLRLIDEPSAGNDDSIDVSLLAMSGVADSSEEGGAGADDADEETYTPTSVNMSPISQTSPISMTPFQASPMNSEINSPIAATNALVSDKSILAKIHSRRFREYCNQILDKEIDECCTALLQDLVRFQDRLYQKDPTKAKSKRRFVLGLREVTKHIKLKKIKCVVISPNLERIQSKGGLDEALNNIINMCHEQDVPFVFALGRKALGRACAKLVPVSCVGVFNYEGSEMNYKKLMQLTENARRKYEEMVQAVATEMASVPQLTPAQQQQYYRSATSAVGSAIQPQIYTHLGHSRTPSACSAISFASSILSQPISENYPQSEPETDSRGYEIVHNESKGERRLLDTNVGVSEGRSSRSESPSSVVESKAKSTNEIDEGHEADDDEEFEQHKTKLKRRAIRHDTERTLTSMARIDSVTGMEDAPAGEVPGNPSHVDINLPSRDVAESASTIVIEDSIDCNIATTLPEDTAGELTVCQDHERIECWVAESRRQTVEQLEDEISSVHLNNKQDEEGSDSDHEHLTDNEASNNDDDHKGIR